MKQKRTAVDINCSQVSQENQGSSSLSVVLPAINTFVFDFSLVFVLNNRLHILYYHVLPNIFLYCLFIFVDYCSAARCGLWLSCRGGVAGTAQVHYGNHDFPI